MSYSEFKLIESLYNDDRYSLSFIERRADQERFFRFREEGKDGFCFIAPSLEVVKQRAFRWMKRKEVLKVEDTLSRTYSYTLEMEKVVSMANKILEERK